ncbi:MAG: DUF427 domain-containing protein [Halioglobus sp.]
MWEYNGQKRPAFASKPGPGCESVWDYPRPPVLQPTDRRVRVSFDGREIARTASVFRILETASPPSYYLPESSVDWSRLVRCPGSSFCEWKGEARYWALASNPAEAVAWSYGNPRGTFAAVRDAVSFYPGRVDCFVDDERVRAQPGHFYGGWITDEIVGPVKGEPGTGHW